VTPIAVAATHHLTDSPGRVSAVNLPSRWLAILDVALLACGLWVVACSPLVIVGDAESRYRSLEELMLNGKMDNTSYSLLGPALAAPLWKLGETPEERRELVSYFNLGVFAIAAFALFFSLRRHIGAERTRRFLLLLLFGTAFPHELQNFNNEVLSSLALGAGLLGLLSLKGWPRVLGSTFVVLGTANMPGLAIGSGLSVLQLVQFSKRLRFLLVPLLCAGAVCLEAWLRRGSAFTSGYEGNAGFKTALPYSGLPGFSYPFALGALSILFSFGKGLLFFYPGLFLPAWRWLKAHTPEARALHRAWLLVVFGLLLVYSRWWSWYGGFCWGPRFFLFAGLPACLAMALWSRQARSMLSALAACTIIAWALWVGYAGLVFSLSNLDICAAKNYRLESFCWYVPEFSVLIRPFVVTRELVEWEANALTLFVIVYLRITLNLWLSVITEAVQQVIGAPPRVLAWIRGFHV